jgi:DNA helicase-2/ATP-dependent DNA helicase PcrA
MVHAAWDSEEEARAIGEEIEQAQIKGRALNDMAILVRASFQMREFEERFVTLGLNYRVIGGPRFYERQEIRDAMAFSASSASPPTISPSSASSMCPSAAWAKRRCARSTTSPAPAASPCSSRARTDPHRRAQAKPRKSLTDVVEMFTRWQACWKPPPATSWPKPSSRNPATPRCGRTTAPPTRRPGSKT